MNKQKANQNSGFNLNKKRKELFEKELLGKITSAGRIYRMIIAQDKDFIRLLKKVFNPQFEDDWAEKQIDKLAGERY